MKAISRRKQMASEAPDEILLELVDENGVTVGVAEKVSAHQAPGRLHRAFSVFLVDDSGRMLLQRRALHKYHSPGVWSNSCCGHPFPGETPSDAAARRTFQELGVAPSQLTAAGEVTYRHLDPISGLVEYEYNHLFVGLLTDKPRPDPSEVAEIALVTPEELEERLAPGSFSVWFPDVLQAAIPAIRALLTSVGVV